MTPSLLGTLAPGALALLGQEDGLDVGEHAALGDDHAGQQFVELFVVPTRVNISSDSEYKALTCLMVCWRWRGMWNFLLSGAVLPASSRILAARYSITQPCRPGRQRDTQGVVALPALKH